MFSQYFGNFLLNKGILTPSQLDQVMELQKSAHVKLGVLSINAGFMSPEQVEEVHQKQMQVDKRFGEIAIEMGYLTHVELNQILSSQKHSHLLLGQVLIDENLLTIEAFTKLLNEYKEEFGLSDEQFRSILNGDINTLISTIINLDKSKHYTIIKDYLSLFAKNVIRFVDEQVRLEAIENGPALTKEWLVSQKICGEFPLQTAILADDTVFIDIAKKYSQEEIVEANDLAQASVGEFLNLHNGIFLVNMSNQDIELEMEPQEVSANHTLELEDVHVIKIHISSGPFYLVINEL